MPRGVNEWAETGSGLRALDLHVLEPEVEAQQHRAGVEGPLGDEVALVDVGHADVPAMLLAPERSYSGLQAGTRPPDQGAPAASAFFSRSARSTSTRTLSFSRTGANACAAISYPRCSVPVGAELEAQRL